MLNHFSHVQVFVTPWTVAGQAPLSTGFSRQEHRSGLSFPSPRNLPNPGIELSSHISCIVGWVLYHQHHLGSPGQRLNRLQKDYNCLHPLSRPNSTEFNRMNIKFPDPAHLLLRADEWEEYQEVAQDRVWHIAICPKFYYYYLITHFYFLQFMRLCQKNKSFKTSFRQLKARVMPFILCHVSTLVNV